MPCGHHSRRRVAITPRAVLVGLAASTAGLRRPREIHFCVTLVVVGDHAGIVGRPEDELRERGQEGPGRARASRYFKDVAGVPAICRGGGVPSVQPAWVTARYWKTVPGGIQGCTGPALIMRDSVPTVSPVLGLKTRIASYSPSASWWVRAIAWPRPPVGRVSGPRLRTSGSCASIRYAAPRMAGVAGSSVRIWVPAS